MAYVRFHGAEGKYHGSYARDQLRRWAVWMLAAAQAGIDVYAYFNNDREAQAVKNAQALRELVAARA